MASDVSDLFWNEMDSHSDERTVKIVRDVLGNYRPGGNSSIQIVLGSKGTTLTADPSNEESHHVVDFPCRLRKVLIKAVAPGGTGTFDLFVQRPTQAISAAASILGSHPLTLTSAREVTITPSSDWTTYIEAGSTIMPYILSASGLTLVTLNLIVYNYPGVPWGRNG